MMFSTLSLHDALPIYLRVRMVMADMWGSWRVARGKGRTIRGAPIQSSAPPGAGQDSFQDGVYDRDRKSTRLNSSHRCISYAVSCFKKKKHMHGDDVTL